MNDKKELIILEKWDELLNENNILGDKSVKRLKIHEAKLCDPILCWKDYKKPLKV